MDKITCEIDPHGTRRWRNAQGQLHRSDGPAVVYRTGTKMWKHNGQKHRLDGPAVVLTMPPRKYWFIDNIEYNDELTYWMAVSEWKKANG